MVIALRQCGLSRSESRKVRNRISGRLAPLPRRLPFFPVVNKSERPRKVASACLRCRPNLASMNVCSSHPMISTSQRGSLAIDRSEWHRRPTSAPLPPVPASSSYPCRGTSFSSPRSVPATARARRSAGRACLDWHDSARSADAFRVLRQAQLRTRLRSRRGASEIG
jgi:hypothetical protein